ncbi:hypothetical protein AMECASPLE_018014 [Ameca splendens]|uniref:Uncharacterized protein n=1 Tax=Ameca splendens TaxID=208324 RepID=A0ABV0XFP0_9TELE
MRDLLLGSCSRSFPGFLDLEYMFQENYPGSQSKLAVVSSSSRNLPWSNPAHPPPLLLLKTLVKLTCVNEHLPVPDILVEPLLH